MIFELLAYFLLRIQPVEHSKTEAGIRDQWNVYRVWRTECVSPSKGLLFPLPPSRKLQYVL